MFHVKHSGGEVESDNVSRDRVYYTEPTGVVASELYDRGSRFIGRVEPFTDGSLLKERIAERRNEHPAATHVVYAYAVGVPSPNDEGCSDDGEPHGTAGRPVLDAIGYAHLTNTLITVVRYFGGTKLGTGGLVRAYGDSARRAIAEANVRRCVERTTFHLSLPYELYDSVRKRCTQEGVDLVGEDFGEQVQIRLSVERILVEELDADLLELSGGAISLRR